MDLRDGVALKILRAAIAVVFAVTALVVFQPLPALAHAELATTEPVDHASLDEPPTEVVLTFTEEVTALPGAIRVFDAAGERVDEGSVQGAEGSTVLSTSLTSGLGDGAYIVSWDVVSLDDHPISGAFVFQVGSGPVADDDLIASILSGADASGARTAGVAVRWITYAGSLVAVGATAMLFSLRVETARLAIRRLVLIAATIGVIGSVLSVPVQGAEVSGLGWSVVSASDLLSEVLAGGVGRAAMVRIAGLVALMIAVWALGRSKSLPVALAGPAAAVVLVADLLTGHTVTTEPTWLVMTADTVHLAAAALWTGGLAALLVALRLVPCRGRSPGCGGGGEGILQDGYVERRRPCGRRCRARMARGSDIRCSHQHDLRAGAAGQDRLGRNGDRRRRLQQPGSPSLSRAVGGRRAGGSVGRRRERRSPRAAA